MKQSFLRKLMVGTMVILGLTFFLQIILQTRVLPLFIINETRNNIESELQSIDFNVPDLTDVLEQLSTSTGTFSSLVDPSEVTSQQYDFRTVTLTTSNGDSFTVIQPRTTGLLRIGTAIDGRFYTTDRSDFLVPISLVINDRMVFGSERIGDISPDLKEQLGVSETVITLEGTITSVQQVVVTSAKESYTNSELLNLMSGNNIQDLEQLTPTTLRYESVDNDENPLNLVYVTQITNQSSNLLLFSIFPLTNITLITSALARFNVIIFTIALILVGILYFFYFRRISIPLIEISNATKRFASLDFTPITVSESEDEIGELSRNINYLSANLSNAMTMLNDQNSVLSQQLESEQQRDQQRKDFVAGVSHELKTPLAIIQATYEAIKEGILSTEELPEYYQTIENEIRRANRIIQDMMQVYRFDQGSIELQQDVISMKDLIQANFESYSPLLDQANLTMTIQSDESTLIADEEQIQLVLSNLISNTIKYSTPHSIISVTWDSGQLILQNHTSMTDANDVHRLTEPFYRGDKSRNRNQESTGLGLYIVKQILDLHQFELDVSIDGDVFTVSINTVKK